MSDDLIGRFVAEARDAGLSWTEIGQRFGTSKQAVQQRYGALLSQPGAWPGRWSPDAREALERAGEESRALRHDYIGTEHVLLALLSRRGMAAEVLGDHGVTRERIFATDCMQPATDDRAHDECVSIMPRLKQALEHSRRVADLLGADVADPEHLLAGVLAVRDSMAVEILGRLGARPDDILRGLAERLEVQPQRLAAPRRRRRLLGAARS
jgi:ATP-dependent Clp protease ATP-binding subunit ClpA